MSFKFHGREGYVILSHGGLKGGGEVCKQKKKEQYTCNKASDLIFPYRKLMDTSKSNNSLNAQLRMKFFLNEKNLKDHFI